MVLPFPDAPPHEERRDREDRGVHQGAVQQPEHGQVCGEPCACLEQSEVRDQEEHVPLNDPGAKGYQEQSKARNDLDGSVNDREAVPIESEADEKVILRLTRVMNRKQRKVLEKNVHDVDLVYGFSGCKGVCQHDCHQQNGDHAVSPRMKQQNGDHAVSPRMKSTFDKSSDDADVDDDEIDVMMVHIDDCFGNEVNNDDADFGEVFSMPRIAPVAQRKGLKVLGSFDIGNGWDFRLKEHRQKCRQQIQERKPKVLVVCPPCGPFSPLQRLSRSKGNEQERERKRVEGEVLLAFAMEICEMQREAGRTFVFEHPKGSEAWSHDAVVRIRDQKGVFEIRLDLKKTCDGNHEHQRIEGQVKAGGKWVNRSRCAQIYPKALVDGLVRLAKSEVEKQALDVFTAEMLSGKNPHLESAVRRCHVNLGHPSKERFIHMLKSANASEGAIELAKRLECSTCSAKRLQSSHPISKHRRAEAFNEQLCMDTFDLPIYQQKVLKMLNIVDEGTNLQLCIPLWKGARASEVRKAYRKYWKRWAGVPKRILTDGGGEFDEAAQEGFDRDGSYVEKTAAFAPWQNGLAERNGGIWKAVFAKAYEEGQPRNKDEVNELIDQVNVARNSMGRRYGFIPYQHVFGGDFRLPGLLTEGENTSHLHQSGASVVHAADSFWTRQKMRMAARKAMVEADEKDKVIRAVEHRSRPLKDFQVGQLVYYWRRFPKDDKKGAWRGPARVIGYFDSLKIWVCHGNRVLRCAPEQVRALTTDQEAAVKFVPIELQSQAGRFAKHGAQTFIDVSNQGKPPNEEGAEITNAESRTKRRKTQARDAEDDEMEDDQNMLEEEGQSVLDEGAIDEETTTDNGGLDRMVSAAPTMGQENVPGPMPEYDIAGNAYGPIRRRDDHQREDPLTTALRRSTELLDLGQSRTRRAADDETADVLEVTIFDSDETGDERHGVGSRPEECGVAKQ